MLKRLVKFLSLGLISQPIGGIVPDKSAIFGLMGTMANLNLYSEAVISLATSGTNITLTAAQAIIGVTRLTTGASGGFTITLPSTAQLLAALSPATIPTDGTFAIPISFQNDGTGQTGTLTVGDASTTITGTATIANNTRRLFMLTVNAGGTTISLQNIGSLAL